MKLSRSGLFLAEAVLEGGTGIAAIVVPALVLRLLFNSETDEVGTIATRLAGMAILALAAGCWRVRQSAETEPMMVAMLGYNALAALLFLLVGSHAVHSGMLLWPAAIFHIAMIVLLVTAREREPQRRANCEVRNRGVSENS